MFLELRSMVLLFTIYLLDCEIIILMTFATAFQSHICSIWALDCYNINERIQAICYWVMAFSYPKESILRI